MQEVKTLDEAKQYFLSHSSGSILCIDPDGNKKKCDCFPEAVEFFQRK